MLLAAFFFSEMGRSFYFIVISWVLYKITRDAMYTGLLVSMGFLPGMLLNLILGVMVDKFNRKWLAVLANFLSILAVLVVFLGLVTNFIFPWLIVGVHMFIQIAGSLFRPSIQSFISEIFEKKELPNIFSKTSAAAEVGGLLGSSLGGLIVASFSETASIFLTILFFFFATILISFIKKERIEAQKVNRQSMIKDLAEGFTYVKSNRILLGLFAVMFVGQLVFHTSTAFLSVFTKEYLHQSVKVYGFLDAAISVGGIIAGIFGAWWWRSCRNLLAVRSLFVVFGGLLIMGVSSNIFLAVTGIFLIGLGTTWIRILLQSIQQIVTDDNYHGRMASFRMMCNQTSVVISGPIIGTVASHYGVNYAYLALLIPVSLCLIFSVFQSKLVSFKEVTKVSF
jgi:MFS transporter, DHA3 family, macrolide efflux protein